MSLALWEYFWSTAAWVVSTSTGRGHGRKLIQPDLIIQVTQVRL